MTTDDGYTLSLYRIPEGISSQANRSKGPVLLVPGLAYSCSVFLVNGPGRSLAFIMADAGEQQHMLSF